jgi:hypothetical protein
MGNCKNDTMNIKLSIGILALLMISCIGNQKKDNAKLTVQNKLAFDTIIGSKIITNEIAGSAYRKRAIAYFVITNKDTSDYTCIFSESKKDGKVAIDLNSSYAKVSKPYRKRLEELKLILPKASRDFNFDSLTGVYLGRLVVNGDLAIDITKQYRQKFGANNKLQSYSTVQQFLKESKLSIDLNNVLKPYFLKVEEVYIEKLFFTSKQDLYWASKIETDSTNVPDKIIDCMTGVKLIKH